MKWKRIFVFDKEKGQSSEVQTTYNKKEIREYFKRGHQINKGEHLLFQY